MCLKLLCVVFLTLCVIQNCASDVEDDLTDFDFNGEDPNQNEGEDGPGEKFENYVDYAEEVDTKPLQLSKEALVKQVIMNSMRSKEMKDKMAKVLPILRVMTPDQKLALATLVTTQVLSPADSQGLTLDQVTAMFGNNANTTAELMLPISLDVANLFRMARNEKGPTAEELRAPYKRPPGLYRRNIIDRAHTKFFRPRKPSKPFNNSKEQPNCELFSAGICLQSHDYPLEAIMSSIHRNKHAMGALLTDVKSMPSDGINNSISSEQEVKQSSEDNVDSNEIRRTGGESGYMCPSIVRYARPQKARATNGQWKYIVNTAEHTQTLRLERCMTAGDTCTYLTDNFKSRCVQVFNYHRLLTWDKANGLHMDIFKVPTCCSCHIDSYKVPFPPHHSNHATTSEDFPGEEIENLSVVTTPVESEYYSNSIPGSIKFRKELPHSTHQLDYSETNHHHESTKVRPSIDSFQPESTKSRPSVDNYQNEASKVRPSVDRPGLSKYLEAPRPEAPLPKPNFNHNFKRSNTPKPFSNGVKRPTRPVRRRQPSKPVRDLAFSESNFGSYSTDTPPSTSTMTTKDFTKKINYNYHPIIDFFKPDPIESRMDVHFEDSDWKPVTSMLYVTERSNLRRR